jgi:hypothetical protein
MLTPEELANQQALLATYRRTLAHLLQQAAQYGGVPFAPPQTANGISEAHAQIQQLKARLCADGVVVEDEPGDELPAAPLQTQHPGIQASQSSIGQAQGSVSQHFGEQTTIDTGGGAYIAFLLDL